MSTAPHQSRKKRELTRAVELLKIKYGGEREPHRLLSAPLALSANVFTSLTADEFTVNGAKVSTILTPCFKGLAVFRDFIAPTPAGDHPQLWVYIGVLRLFGAIEVWKLVGLIYKINTNKVIQKTEFLRIYCVACRVLKYLNVLTLSLTATLHLNIFYLLSFIFYLLSISLM